MCVKFKHLLLVLFVLTAASTITAQKNTNSSKGKLGNFQTIERQYPTGTIDGYNLYVPNSCNSKSEPFPVLICLQGGLGVGGKVEKIYRWGLPKMLKDGGIGSPELDNLLLNTFVILMPHIASGEFYTSTDTFELILSEISDKYNIDESRIYLTGLSRGGYGTWGLGDRMNGHFAAIAPICGGSVGIKDYNSLSEVPIWASHNTEDGVVPYRATTRIIGKLERDQGRNFLKTASIEETPYLNNRSIFTSTESNSHDAWTEMYTNVKFYKWLLQFKN